MWQDKGKSQKRQSTAKTAEASKSRIADIEEGRPDYRIYRLSASECVRFEAIYLLLDVAVSYLFFESALVFVLLLPGSVWFIRECSKMLQKRRAEQIKKQFMDGIQMMAASLQAGYSAENALRESIKELVKVYEPNAIIIREFRLISAQLSMSRSLEELFLDFGRRSAVDDIRSFAEVLLTAKRSGGDLLAVIRNTVFCIRQKQETLQEIETSLSGKIMEQNIMSMIPIFILAYIKLTSPGFLDVMYGNLTGTAVMTICFLVYVGAYFWGKRIVRIEV
ncbi:MAG: type II secretion system F family protein [Lachnospiraceae bacterium]|uniref:type II secretion system F family protein n=1 Tax=Parablautia sp. Marseille-Q6255 TaxID=3039593 RepID=UPI0024BC26E9|nr:type II secretion system F family protein [Parablautia sp. Marseille-Q6255]